MIVTQSSRIRKLMKVATRVAKTSASVLLSGESGTGKELFAKLIHAQSHRGQAPYIKVNCAALPQNLIESELFGHERGSFTDAVDQRVGRFEAASGGTILLDEISEVSTVTQVKLLRVLEESQFERVGSNQPIAADARIIATSNRDLRAEVQSGTFRLDLFHRLNVIEIEIPPLRERREDIPLLASHFVNMFKHENEIEVRGFTKTGMQKLAAYSWPGNVRQLRNSINRACILTEKPLIDAECLELREMEEPPKPSELPDNWLKMKLVDIEKQVIKAALDKYQNKRNVARVLGVSPRTLTNKLKIYRENEGQKEAAA